MKALVVGRHTDAIPGVEIVELRAITFPAKTEDCVPILCALWKEVEEKGIKLLFQNLPGQVGVACANIMRGNPPLSIGVIVSVPGPRHAGVESSAEFDNGDAATKAADLIKFANPRSKVAVVGNTVNVTADPPMVFCFSHIEWM